MLCLTKESGQSDSHQQLPVRCGEITTMTHWQLLYLLAVIAFVWWLIRASRRRSEARNTTRARWAKTHGWCYHSAIPGAEPVADIPPLNKCSQQLWVTKGKFRGLYFSMGFMWEPLGSEQPDYYFPWVRIELPTPAPRLSEDIIFSDSHDSLLRRGEQTGLPVEPMQQLSEISHFTVAVRGEYLVVAGRKSMREISPQIEQKFAAGMSALGAKPGDFGTTYQSYEALMESLLQAATALAQHMLR